MAVPVRDKKIRRASPAEIITREWRTRLAGYFLDMINPVALTQLANVPNYNRNSVMVMDVKAEVIAWSSDPASRIKLAIMGNTDGSTFWTDPGSGIRMLSGQRATFDISGGLAPEAAQLYVSGGDGVAQIVLSATLVYKSGTNDYRFDADHTVGWIGDSICGPTANADLVQSDYHHFATVTWLMLNSTKKEIFRLCNIASGGRSSVNYNDLLNKGGVGSNPVNLSIEFYQMGMNDLGGSIPTATYKANIKRWIKHRKANYPGIVLVLLGTTPAQSATRQANLDPYRIALAECVLEEQALTDGTSLGERIIGIDLGHCFDRTNPARWATSDGTGGDALHPGDVTANRQMYEKICLGTDFDTVAGQLGKNFVTVAAPNGMLPAGGLLQRDIFNLLKSV